MAPGPLRGWKLEECKVEARGVTRRAGAAPLVLSLEEEYSRHRPPRWFGVTDLLRQNGLGKYHILHKTMNNSYMSCIK